MMYIGVFVEMWVNEVCVVVMLEIVKKYVVVGYCVSIVKGVGSVVSYFDEVYVVVGVELIDQLVVFVVDFVLKVQVFIDVELLLFKCGVVLVGMFELFNGEQVVKFVVVGVIGFVFEVVLCIMCVQSFDVLLLQVNIVGYKVVLVVVLLYLCFMLMLMMVVGIVKVVCVLIFGVGVVGLQVIVIVKWLGVVIEVFDVWLVVKEQIELFGVKFFDVLFEIDEECEVVQGVGGYVCLMLLLWFGCQVVFVYECVKQVDIVIIIVLIFGCLVLMLILVDIVQLMKFGLVFVDFVVGCGLEIDGCKGGNCLLIVVDQVIVYYGVMIVGYMNFVLMVVLDVLVLYVCNLLDFMKLIVMKEGMLNIDLIDDIVVVMLLCCDGEFVCK